MGGLTLVLGVLLSIELTFCRELFGASVWNQTYEDCPPGPRGRVPWIIHERRDDYGWGKHTPRAIIALAVNKYKDDDKMEWERMDLQLEMEIAQALRSNSKEPVYENDLALLIHSLVARSKNPRNFYTIDLVAELLTRLEPCFKSESCDVHPYLILAMCNSGVIKYDHLLKLKRIAEHTDDEIGQDLEIKALALKAFACAASLDNSLKKFELDMKQLVQCLHSKQQKDGSFGNPYTTALAVQALTTYDAGKDWKEDKALDYLLKEAEIDVNMIKAYYIEMALNARNVKFIKDLSKEFPPTPAPLKEEVTHFVMYSVKKDEHPDMYTTITMKVPHKYNFYQIMQKSAKELKDFRFDYYKNAEGNPVIYSVAGIPNNAEEDLFWRLCEQKIVTDVRVKASTSEIHISPARFVPAEGSHLIFWYRNSNCPEKAEWFPASVDRSLRVPVEIE